MHAFGQNTAGASTAFSKFVAFTALTIHSLTATMITAGTSTYTAWNGTATVSPAILADQYSLIRVTNTASAGATPALSTSTYGPYALSLYNGTATATQTNAAGFSNNVALSQTGAGSNTADGGFTVNQGDTLHVVRGTDATAVSAFSMEYSVTPLANVTK
jgi:hypothetical protein